MLSLSRVCFFAAAVALILCLIVPPAPALEPRQPFDIPLALLSIAYAPNGTVEDVTISYGDNFEAWTIGPGNDRHVKNTRRLQEDRTYKEIPTMAFLLSTFEAGQLDRICTGLVKTLNLFEHDVKRENYDKLRYLDAFFPSFMKGFFHLVRAAYATNNILPPVTDISPALFENSFDSPRTDARIAVWQGSEEHRLKLRIAAKEAACQIALWQKNFLADRKRNPRDVPPDRLCKAWELFVRIYFNLRPFTANKDFVDYAH